MGGIFDQSLQPLKSDIIVIYPFTTSINTEAQKVDPLEVDIAGTFTKDPVEHWLVVNTNLFEGTDLPAWVTDESYFLPFEWELGNKSDWRTSITQGYGGNLKCELLTGNTFQQINMVSGITYLRIGVTIPISDGGFAFCQNDQTMDDGLLKTGIHPFAMEWVWSLKASKPPMEVTKKLCKLAAA